MRTTNRWLGMGHLVYQFVFGLFESFPFIISRVISRTRSTASPDSILSCVAVATAACLPQILQILPQMWHRLGAHDISCSVASQRKANAHKHNPGATSEPITSLAAKLEAGGTENFADAPPRTAPLFLFFWMDWSPSPVRGNGIKDRVRVRRVIREFVR